MTQLASGPSPGRHLAALSLGLTGTLVAGAGAGLLALAADRRYPGGWQVGAGAVAVVGLLVVIAATRVARLPSRRTLIVVLGALLLVPPIAQTVRTNVAGATVYSPGKRTAAEMRDLGFALEARAVDENGYPATAELDALAPLLVPRYIRAVPRLDGWRRALRYEADGSGAEARYFIGSAGSDGRWERARLADYRDQPGPHGDDVVYSNGGFVALPPP
jgi:hypothetical protein